LQNRELESYWRFISSSLDRLIACLEGLAEAELNWRPLSNANSLYALAVHTMANAEENILATLCGQSVHRQRESEFSARGSSSEPVRAQWMALRERLAESLASLPSDELDREREHPRRGPLTGREVLLVVARHAAEHLGQAELTRDWLRANHDQSS
jgi:uncharacterized damage-inducible protein DinB